MSSPAPERLARRAARARRTRRRRRIGAGSALVALAAVLAWLALGDGSSRHTGMAPAAGASRRGASGPTAAGVHVLVRESGQLPAPVQDAAAAPAGSAGPLLIGGLDSAEASVADVLQINAGEARRIGALPTALHDACASAVAGRVYVFGGGQLTSFSQILSVGSAGAAQPVGALPTPASDVACTTVAGNVYIVGGYTGQEPLRTIVSWRPGGTPRVVALLPKPLRYAAVGQSGGQVMIAGGTSGLQASRDVYRFDPLSGKVRELTRLPYPVTHAAGASLGGALLVIGGRGASPASQRRDILAVSPTGALSVAATLPRALSDAVAVESREAVILAGGRDNAGRVQSAILEITLKR